jgi:DNA-binding response OmpR family regulator
MSMKLLIIEHSQAQLARVLGLLGVVEGLSAILTSRSLAQAFRTIQAEQPALVIVDLHMPDGNALQSMKHMKRLSTGVQIAALVFEPSRFDRTWCLDAGADFVVDKTTEFGDLLGIVQNIWTQL